MQFPTQKIGKEILAPDIRAFEKQQLSILWGAFAAAVSSERQWVIGVGVAAVNATVNTAAAGLKKNVKGNTGNLRPDRVFCQTPSPQWPILFGCVPFQKETRSQSEVGQRMVDESS